MALTYSGGAALSSNPRHTNRHNEEVHLQSRVALINWAQEEARNILSLTPDRTDAIGDPVSITINLAADAIIFTEEVEALSEALAAFVEAR